MPKVAKRPAISPLQRRRRLLQTAHMLCLVGLVSGAFIASPLHAPQQHHARALLPRAAPSAIVFDPGSAAVVAVSSVVYIPIRLAITESIDALEAVVTGTPLEVIRVEVRALPPVRYPLAQAHPLPCASAFWQRTG